MGNELTKRFQVGVITTPHGLRGEVKVYPTTDDPWRFKILKELILKEKRGERVLKVRSVKFFKQFAILKFKGIDSINEIERYRGRSLLIDREDGVPLDEDEYYIADIIGMEVFTEDGKRFGTLRDVLETGANDVYIIDTAEYGEVLVPAIRDCILDVDTREGRMEIRLLKGLIS